MAQFTDAFAYVVAARTSRARELHSTRTTFRYSTVRQEDTEMSRRPETLGLRSFVPTIGTVRRQKVTVKLVALWTTPQDVEGFETDYRDMHIPLVGKLPALKGAVASKALDGPYYRMAELIFEDADGLQSAMGSAEGQALVQDAGRLQESYGTKLEIMTVEEQARI
jgi:uncharacterized protein (TIGR02118 family)